MGWKGGRGREGRGKEEEAGRLSMRERFRAPAILSSISSFIYHYFFSLPPFLLPLSPVPENHSKGSMITDTGSKEGRGEGTNFENLLPYFHLNFASFYALYECDVEDGWFEDKEVVDYE